MKTIETIDYRHETIDKSMVRRKNFFFVFLFCLSSIVYSLSSYTSHAAESAPAAAPVTPKAEKPVAVESEKAKDWKGLQAQEQWVARLKKQIDGESKQLSEMRGRTAEKFKLDPKKLDAGAYIYDEKKDAFVDTSVS